MICFAVIPSEARNPYEYDASQLRQVEILVTIGIPHSVRNDKQKALGMTSRKNYTVSNQNELPLHGTPFISGRPHRPDSASTQSCS